MVCVSDFTYMNETYKQLHKHDHVAAFGFCLEKGEMKVCRSRNSRKINELLMHTSAKTGHISHTHVFF